MKERIKTLGYNGCIVAAMSGAIIVWLHIVVEFGSAFLALLPVGLYAPIILIERARQHVAPKLVVRNRSLIAHFANALTVTIVYVILAVGLFVRHFSLFDPFWYDVMLYVVLPASVALGALRTFERSESLYEEVRTRVADALRKVMSR